MKYLFAILLLYSTVAASQNSSSLTEKLASSLSNCTYKIIIGQYGNGETFGAGSGFFIKSSSGKSYFVTARHVIVDPETDQLRNDTVRIRVYETGGHSLDMMGLAVAGTVKLIIQEILGLSQ